MLGRYPLRASPVVGRGCSPRREITHNVRGRSRRGRLVHVRRHGMFVVLAALLAADLWFAWTLWNAVTASDGRGAVFWSAVGLIALCFLVLLWLTRQVARQVRETSLARAERS